MCDRASPAVRDNVVVRTCSAAQNLPLRSVFCVCWWNPSPASLHDSSAPSFQFQPCLAASDCNRDVGWRCLRRRGFVQRAEREFGREGGVCKTRPRRKRPRQSRPGDRLVIWMLDGGDPARQLGERVPCRERLARDPHLAFTLHRCRRARSRPRRECSP